tara:strand:+ start:886 stop:1074 length:189 start_codon:yes stop_codon:yes gene_type:complete
MTKGEEHAVVDTEDDTGVGVGPAPETRKEADKKDREVALTINRGAEECAPKNTAGKHYGENR